ncbi:MAG: acyltransferase [Pseudomonadota bacterium]
MVSVDTTPPAGAQERPHLAELDGFRAFSILAVLAAHMLPLGPSGWLLNSASGHMGMSVFFCLSGFLITSFLWNRPDIPAFLIRRFARIVPSILLVSVVFCIVLSNRPDSFMAVNLYYINYADEMVIPELSPLWSVALEMQFYVTIALIVLAFGRRGFWLIPIFALLVTGNRIATDTFSGIQTHIRIDEILSGCLLALIWVNQDQSWAKRAGRVMAMGLYPFIVLWALSCWPHMHELGFLRPYLCAAMVGGVLFSTAGWLHNLLSHRVLRYIAAISFALYVWHSPFRFGWFDPESTVQKYLIARPIGLAATFAIAHFSTFYYERVINDWARRWTSGARARHSAHSET